MNESEPQKRRGSSRRFFRRVGLALGSRRESFCRAWLRELIVSTLFQTLIQKAGRGHCWGAEGTHKTWIRHPLIFGVFLSFLCSGGRRESTLFLELDFSEQFIFDTSKNLV
jgi:hypothetical protein